MEYLPAEIQLKILKNLNFDELIKIKQTNRHFYDFINKYEKSLARKRFNRLSFTFGTDKMQKFELIDFPLRIHLQRKWLFAVNKKIPTMIGDIVPYQDVALHFFPEKGSNKKDYSLKLPLIPRNIEELKIFRYWLLKIVRCVFDDIRFNYIFNPEMFKLLFDREEISKLKFNCKRASIFFKNQNIDAFKFTFDRLIIGEDLRIIFKSYPTTRKGNNILFKLLSNAGDRINKVKLVLVLNPAILYNLINHIETSKDLSKMVAKIQIKCIYFLRSKLIIRGVEMSESNDKEKCYKITNINDSKIMFLIKYYFESSESVHVECIEISRLY